MKSTPLFAIACAAFWISACACAAPLESNDANPQESSEPAASAQVAPAPAATNAPQAKACDTTLSSHIQNDFKSASAVKYRDALPDYENKDFNEIFEGLLALDLSDMSDPKVANLMTLDFKPMVDQRRAAITQYLKDSRGLPKNEAYTLMSHQAQARLEMLFWVETANKHTKSWAACRTKAGRE